MISILAFCSAIATTLMLVVAIALLAKPIETKIWEWVDMRSLSARKTMAVLVLLLLIPLFLSCYIIIQHR